MINFRLIFFVTGILVTTLGATMLVPAAVDLVLGNPDWKVFATSSAITIFLGGLLMLTNRSSTKGTMRAREAVLMTNVAWLSLSIFAAVPLALSELELSVTDAFFEAVSGITTTGATVITGLEEAPPGILLWRAVLQWLGGIGIIVMAISILPMLSIGGMQLFQLESSETSEKALPRTAQLASAIGLFYTALTLLCAICYGLAGMGSFDAVAHAMTTISTGGFSTRDGSIGHFDSVAIDTIAITFMITGGLPFILMIMALRGNWQQFVYDRQVHWFLAILAVAIIVMTLYTTGREIADNPGQALRLSAFNVVSVMTGTGYATDSYDGWGAFPLMAFFFLMFIGGCAGSTTCGVKIFRFQVLYAVAKAQLLKLLQPHGVFIAYYNGRPIPDDVPLAVMSFFAMFGLAFGLLAVALGILGLDFLTAISGAATAISNVGPGLGANIGPAGTFQLLPDTAKWLLAFGMLLGRLELFTVLVLFLPHFWRR
ncbi:MAG: TrkH family potassium uptake protein [Alphaproteobacteria bacterium]|nr:TrkH family potassium uptake protein [Alphaproteobacteria bacterium SS10]